MAQADRLTRFARRILFVVGYFFFLLILYLANTSAYTSCMFRKLFTAVSLLIFTGLLVSAQDQAEAPAPVSQKKVSLDKAVPFTADSQQAKISGITVLSAVWDNARIGFLQTGLFNNKVGAVLGNYQVNAPVLLLFNNKVEAVPDKELMRLY